MRKPTLKSYLSHRYSEIKWRCKPNQYYGVRGIRNLFKSFDEFYIHVTIGLGLDNYDKVKGLVIHRTGKHYEPGGIEFLTLVKHNIKHGGKI